MKKLFTVLSVIIFTASMWAESPQKMSYQAVVRNTKGALIVNQTVGVQISIYYYTTKVLTKNVYVETQTPTTNVNGLISIEIGTGTVVEGVFANIDWGARNFYIKTEIDPGGRTSYSITSDTQILSVPYALHAKTAERVSGTGSSAHYVGELYGGGVVCWVDQTGNHGLILSMDDLGTGQAWSNVTQVLETTNEWDGVTNTAAITGQTGHITSAAKLCENYTNSDYGTGTFSDWYLPSIAELNHVLNNIFEIQKPLTLDGNATTTPLDRSERPIYWSSSAIPEIIVIDVDDQGNDIWGTAAWVINFRYNRGDERITVSETKWPNKVRAMRAF